MQELFGGIWQIDVFEGLGADTDVHSNQNGGYGIFNELSCAAQAAKSAGVERVLILDW